MLIIAIVIIVIRQMQCYQWHSVSHLDFFKEHVMLPPRKKVAMSSLIRVSFEAYLSLTLSGQGSLPPYFSPYFWLFVPLFPGFCTGRVFFCQLTIFALEI